MKIGLVSTLNRWIMISRMTSLKRKSNSKPLKINSSMSRMTTITSTILTNLIWTTSNRQTSSLLRISVLPRTKTSCSWTCKSRPVKILHILLKFPKVKEIQQENSQKKKDRMSEVMMRKSQMSWMNTSSLNKSKQLVSDFRGGEDWKTIQLKYQILERNP